MSSIDQLDCAGSAVSSTLTSEASMDDTLGAAFIGYSFCCAIFGILTAQVSNYYQQYAVDPLALKIVVRFPAVHSAYLPTSNNFILTGGISLVCF